MQYRAFGKLDWKVSALGFGCMRFPTVGHDKYGPDIDTPAAIRMLRTAIDHGVNYIDTAYPYHNGNSEVVTGQALQDGYRSRVKLATKSPIWFIKSPADFDKYLNEQLKKLQTDHIDFYLLHSLDADRWQNIILKYDILEQAQRAIRDGRIGYLGFSFHDKYDAFVQIVDGFDQWTFCQIQYNFMDIENQAGMKGLQYAAAKGLAVVIMEPLLGGKLAKPPRTVQEIWDSLPVKRTPVDWALQWLWNQPEVSTVLSGMSSLEQVMQNIQSANVSQVGSLTPEELEAINQVRQTYQRSFPIPCTKCEYCLPCPQGVAIPRNFEIYNNAHAYDDLTGSQNTYNHFFNDKQRAVSCVQCRLCESRCPQKIAISDWMPKVHEYLKAEITK
ncbi:MAG TPA: aldo/keto reductase [Bacillota bacterium]|nr:aldo/keto reductase [Bacillota bacterium]